MADNVKISPPSGNFTLASNAFVVLTDAFVQPERFIKVPWVSPYYWKSSGQVGRYLSAGILPSRVPVRALSI